MKFPAVISKYILHAAIGLILAQLMPSDFPEDTRDSFTAATTPPLEFQIFNQDFASMDLDLMIAWLNPEYGMIKDGVLLTYDEAVASFRDEYSGIRSGEIKAVNLVYNFGEIGGDSHFQVDCWVEWKTELQGADTWLRFHHQFVFKILDQRWYLVQSEFLPEEADVNFDYQHDPNAPDWTSPFRSDIAGASLSEIGAWPLLLGSNYASEAEIHPISGTMFNGGGWSLKSATAQNKPVVLFFISITSGLVESVEDPDLFNSQLDYLSGLYDKYGFTDLYIFAVSDEFRERFEDLAEDGYDQFVPLLDETSEMHATLNISTHPVIIVFNSQGTVVAVTKTWHPSSLGLIEKRISEVVASSKTH